VQAWVEDWLAARAGRVRGVEDEQQWRWELQQAQAAVRKLEADHQRMGEHWHTKAEPPPLKSARRRVRQLRANLRAGRLGGFGHMSLCTWPF
jgi:hypothetical protein